ncbi:MAG: carboxylating nicotinate-nucleotide diphosphorylase [Fibrobacter sp.]|nr:carboxylating nicotinate-nucleotide diphosphorylase [Fibrobacter sp.]
MPLKFSHSEFPVSDAQTLIRLALNEDIGPGDFTSLWTIPATQKQKATLIAKEPGIVAGLPIVEQVFQILNTGVEIENFCQDGDSVDVGDEIASIFGHTQALLTGERVILNFLQQLSGVASVTAQYVKALGSAKTKVLDTRKTLPGFRRLQKYAVRAGGGYNHRMGLHDMILIKDNHIKASGGVLEALASVRAQNKADLKVEIEVENLGDLQLLLGKGVDVIMLDNMDNETMAEAVKMVRKSGDSVKLEASGNMDLERLQTLGTLGLDFVSVGALTHSVKALDISMRIV